MTATRDGRTANALMGLHARARRRDASVRRAFSVWGNARRRQAVDPRRQPTFGGATCFRRRCWCRGRETLHCVGCGQTDFCYGRTNRRLVLNAMVAEGMWQGLAFMTRFWWLQCTGTEKVSTYKFLHWLCVYILQDLVLFQLLSAKSQSYLLRHTLA